VFDAEFLLSDYKGKVLPPLDFMTFSRNDGHLFFELCLLELKEAYRENKLSGKLKDLVATLDVDKDNNVFVILNFK
jgi:hypothetical protein